MKAVKTNNFLLMFTGKIQTNWQVARFFVKLSRRAKATMNLHWNWIEMRLQKFIGPIEEGDKLMQKWTEKNPDLEKNCWGWMILHNAFPQYMRKRDFFSYSPHNNLQHYCNYKVDGRKKVEAEESVRVFQQDSCCYPI